MAHRNPTSVSAAPHHYELRAIVGSVRLRCRACRFELEQRYGDIIVQDDALVQMRDHDVLCPHCGAVQLLPHIHPDRDSALQSLREAKKYGIPHDELEPVEDVLPKNFRTVPIRRM